MTNSKQMEGNFLAEIEHKIDKQLKDQCGNLKKAASIHLPPDEGIAFRNSLKSKYEEQGFTIEEINVTTFVFKW